MLLHENQSPININVRKTRNIAFEIKYFYIRMLNINIQTHHVYLYIHTQRDTNIHVYILCKNILKNFIYAA